MILQGSYQLISKQNGGFFQNGGFWRDMKSTPPLLLFLKNKKKWTNDKS